MRTAGIAHDLVRLHIVKIERDVKRRIFPLGLYAKGTSHVTARGARRNSRQIKSVLVVIEGGAHLLEKKTVMRGHARNFGGTVQDHGRGDGSPEIDSLESGDKIAVAIEKPKC